MNAIQVVNANNNNDDANDDSQNNFECKQEETTFQQAEQLTHQQQCDENDEANPFLNFRLRKTNSIYW